MRGRDKARDLLENFEGRLKFQINKASRT
jgi:hypothetical protein